MADYTFSQTDGGIQYILNLAQNYIAAPFSSSTNYAVGDYCSRNGNIYRCKTAGASAWSSSRWTAVTLADEVTSINQDIALVSGSSTSVTSETWQLLQTMNVSAGLYLFNYGASWSGNTTGYRQVGANADDSNAPSGRTVLVAAGTTGQGTSMSGAKILRFSAAGTFCVWGRQNSGSSLTAYPWIEAVKLR